MPKWRNMQKEGILFAFWDGGSHGTKNMIDTAKRNGIKTVIFEYWRINSGEINRRRA